MKRSAVIIGLPITIIATGAMMMLYFLTFKKDPPKRTPPLRTKVVETAVVELGDVPAEIVAYGRLSSAQPVVLIAEVVGTLEAGDVAFQPAQSFRKGDLLLKIDDRQPRLNLNSTKSSLLNALAQMLPEIRVDFPDEYNVWQGYFNGISFDQEIPELPSTDNQRIKLFLSRFNVYTLYFSVRDQEILLEKHFIRAPFDGSIVSTDLRVGSNARSGTRLGEIISLENLEVEVPVPAQDIQWIDTNEPVTLTSTQVSGTWAGRIKRIGSRIDDLTQSVQVFIGLEKTQRARLYSGLFLRAAIPGRPIPDAYAVPQRAIYGDTNVYIIKNGRLAYREVDIVRKETESSIVTNGIADGDTLVVEVMQGVAPGMLAKARLPGQIEDAQTNGASSAQPDAAAN